MLKRRGKLTLTVRIWRLLEKTPWQTAPEITRRLRSDYHTVASILSHGVRNGQMVGVPSRTKVRGKPVMMYSLD